MRKCCCHQWDLLSINVRGGSEPLYHRAVCLGRYANGHVASGGRFRQCRIGRDVPMTLNRAHFDLLGVQHRDGGGRLKHRVLAYPGVT